MIDTSDNRIYDGKKALVALLLLVSFTLPLTAAPLEIHEKTDAQAMAKLTARPQPTPPVEKPLDADAATALADSLKEGIDADIVQAESLEAIDEKWRVRSLAGKTRTQILTMLFADLKSVVTEKETQDKIWESWKEIGVAEATETETPTETPDEKQTPDPEEKASDKPTTPPQTPAANGNLRQYIRALTYDPRVLLAVQGDGGTLIYEKVNDKKDTRDAKPGKIVRCVRTSKSLSKNFDDVAILQPTQGVIYPGALVYADKNLVDGMPRPLTGLPRSPIDLRLDLPGLQDEGSFVITNPTDGKVQSGVNKALNIWNNGPSFKEGYINPSRSNYTSTLAYSSEQLALSLGVNVKWAQGDASAQFKYSSNDEKTVAVVMYKQVFYTVTYDAPNLPEQFFDASVTPAEAKEAFNAEKGVADAEKQVPAYVSSVNYGRIIMFRLEADKKEKAIDVQAALNYGTGAVSVGVDAKGKYDSILQNSAITVVTMGGSADVASQAVSARSAADLMPIIKGKNAVYSKNNPGVPIAYTVKFLKDSTIAKMGSTTDFTTTDCTELPNLWIKLVHNGWYTAHFDVTWDEPGRPNQTFHSDKNKDYQQTLGFPGDATNIRVNISNDTGLVWEPRREIINRPLVPNELNKCLIIEGTTLGSGKKFETCEKPPPDDLENKRP